jgi:hypothetical protein
MEQETRVSTKQVLGGVRYLFVELLIVFVGVYLAFQLNEYSVEREVNQRRQQLIEALAREIDVFLQGAHQLIPHVDQQYADWRQRYDAGKRPDPYHFEIGGDDRPPRGMWQAVLAAEGLAILPVESMQKVSDYYNALDVLLSKYTNLVEFAEQEIVPYEKTNAFYDPGTVTMKRKYAAYMRRMQDMLQLFRSVRKKAEESKASLEQHKPPS